MPDLQQQLETYVENTIERIDTDDVTAFIGRPEKRAPSRSSLRPAWAFVLGAALVFALGGATWFALQGATWLFGGDETRNHAVAPSVTIPTDEGASSPNPIVAQTQTPLASACPPGSTPDTPGSKDQQRPWGAAGGNQAAVFDEHTGRIILIDKMGATWTFDVCSNTWEKANPTLVPADRQYWYDSSRYPTVLAGELVYDVDSDKTIAFANTRALGTGDVLAVYDATTNTWTQRSQPSEYDTGVAGLGAVYDPVSGLVVVQTTEAGLVTYDVDTDTWTRIGTAEGYLVGYSTETDRLAFLGDIETGGSMVDARSGEASDLNPPAVGVAAGFGYFGYATSTDTPVVVASGGNDICRLNPISLHWTCISPTDGPGSDGTDLPIEAIVGDPINHRIVIFYNMGRRFHYLDDIWAIDFETGEWTQLTGQ